MSRSVNGFLDAEHAKAGVAASKQFVTQKEITKQVAAEEAEESAGTGDEPGDEQVTREGETACDERSVWAYEPVPGELVGDAPPF